MTKRLDEERAAQSADEAAAKLKTPLGDRALLGGAGALLLGLSAFYGWRELQVDPAYLVTVAAAVAVAAANLERNKLETRVGLMTLFLCAALGGGVYAAVRTASLLPGLFVAMGGGLLFLGRGYGRAKRRGDQGTIALGFAALVATALSASWAGYFHFLTAGLATDEVARRLVLTLLWVASGVVLVVVSGRLRELAMRYAGYVFVVAATGKALLYDTTHLGGGLRVLVLLAAGACLLGGSLLSSRQAPALKA